MSTVISVENLGKKFDEIVAFVEIEKCFHRAIYAFIMRYCYLGFAQ